MYICRQLIIITNYHLNTQQRSIADYIRLTK
jgi:hypothetical protein